MTTGQFGLSNKAAKRLLRDGIDRALAKATEEIWRGDKWKALDMLRTIAARHTSDPRALYFTGLALYDLGSTVGPSHGLRNDAWEMAEHFMSYAALLIQRDPKHPHRALLPLCFYNLAKFLVDRGLLSDALEHAQDAVRLNPHGPEGWGMMGDLLAHADRMDEAKHAWRQAATIPATSPESLYNRSFKRILLGDTFGGHADYEQRFACPGYRAEYRRDFWEGAAQAYPGEDGRLHFHWLSNKKRAEKDSHHGEAIPDFCSLLVYAEQGVGDTVQMLRYVPAIRERFRFHGPIVLEVQEACAELARSMAGMDSVTVVPRGDKLPGLHAHISLMSLPFAFEGDPLGGAAYLRAEPDAPRNPFGLKRVGFCWAGSTSHKGDRFRSMPFRHALPLAQTPGVEWVSLQWGDRESEAGQVTWLKRNHGRWNGLGDTARCIAGLDAVVTIDTSVAHVAGALGVPTLLLLPVVPDARWEIGRNDSRWYSSIQILRQSSPNDWDGVIRRLGSILQRPQQRVA